MHLVDDHGGLWRRRRRKDLAHDRARRSWWRSWVTHNLHVRWWSGRGRCAHVTSNDFRLWSRWWRQAHVLNDRLRCWWCRWSHVSPDYFRFRRGWCWQASHDYSRWSWAWRSRSDVANLNLCRSSRWRCCQATVYDLGRTRIGCTRSDFLDDDFRLRWRWCLQATVDDLGWWRRACFRSFKNDIAHDDVTGTSVNALRSI